MKWDVTNISWRTTGGAYTHEIAGNVTRSERDGMLFRCGEGHLTLGLRVADPWPEGSLTLGTRVT